MNYTTNFNLNKPEGTDLYNHLTVDNPNMDTIDAAMQANKLASVGAATELVSGTVHAITRSDSNQNIFKFKATGNFRAGDSITVDGVTVNAFTTNGKQLADNAYVLSAEVLCILDNTSLWVMVTADESPFSPTVTPDAGITDGSRVYIKNNVLYASIDITNDNAPGAAWQNLLSLSNLRSKHILSNVYAVLCDISGNTRYVQAYQTTDTDPIVIRMRNSDGGQFRGLVVIPLEDN